jgi:hypothetical protein
MTAGLDCDFVDGTLVVEGSKTQRHAATVGVAI